MHTRFHTAVVAVLLCASPAHAASGTGQFNTTVTVVNNCSIDAADLAFGNYSASSGFPMSASTTLSVTCTSTVPYTVAMDGGVSGQPAARAMNDGASHTLNYGLYTTSAYATPLGDGTNATSTLAGVGTGLAQSLTVYGRIPASQFVTPGSYSDRITVTVAY
jgi:spore coat protein U-like protein